jgi:putative membrane protein
MVESKGRFEAQPTASNHFAWMNTQMGLERTLMSASRTAVSLVGFGFTVAQFFAKMANEAPAGLRHFGPAAPRNFGLTLIAAGVILLAVFTAQYRTATAYLRRGDFAAIAGLGEKTMHSASYMVALVVIIIGVAAFVVVFARL